MIKRKSSITKNANDWRSKGLALFTQEKYDDAIQAYDKAFEIDPKNASAWTGKGDALKNQGKCDEAVLALDKSLEIDSQSSAGLTKADPSSNPYYWVTKALKLWDYNGIYPFDTSTINKDNYKEAIECFNNAIEIDPFKTSWYYAKARICTALSFYAKDMHIQDEFDHYFNETIEIYKKAIKIDPSDVRFWMEIGDFLNQLGKYEKANNAFDRAIEINQNDEWFHCSIWNGKIGALNGIAKTNPHDAEIWYAIGNAWVKRGSDVVSMYSAIQAYDKAIINRPNFVEAWFSKGLALNIAPSQVVIRVPVM